MSFGIGVGDLLASASFGSLASTGAVALRLLTDCVTSHMIADRSLKQQISRKDLDKAEQRFRLWAANLGLFAKGHGSLDYRLRDSELVSNYTREVLIELVEYLDAICKVLRNERPPFEKQVERQRPVSTEDDSQPSFEADNPYTAGDWVEPDWNSGVDDDNNSSSEDDFEELPFRLRGIEERLDSLFTLAYKIRKPLNRPIRSTADLFKHSKAASTHDHVREREQMEGHLIGYMLEQHIMRFLQLDDSLSAEERQQISPNEFCKASAWLINRIGRANTRRKQQFVYWREHSHRLGSTFPSNVPEYRAPNADTLTPFIAVPPSVAGQVPSENEPGQSNVLSNPTTATQLDRDLVSLDDNISVTSSISRVSTKQGWHGEQLEWPDPPKVSEDAKFFVCPYCKTVCPRKYLTVKAWRAHLFHDLQPYQCTFPECGEADRLYGNRTEWVEHEAITHQRVWICQVHRDAEYETRDLLVHHLREEHQNEKDMHLPRIIDACAQTSQLVRRTCPFCPVVFVNVSNMHDHIIFHLERFAALALPKPYELDPDAFSDGGTGDGDERSQSARANVQGRPDDSRVGDFDWESLLSFGKEEAEDERGGRISDARIVQPAQPVRLPRQHYKDAPAQLKKLGTLVQGDLKTRVTSLFGIQRPPPAPDALLREFHILEQHSKVDLFAAVNDMIRVQVNVYREPADRIEIPDLIGEDGVESVRAVQYRQQLATLDREDPLQSSADRGEGVYDWREGVLAHRTYTTQDTEGNILTGWPGMSSTRQTSFRTPPENNLYIYNNRR